MVKKFIVVGELFNNTKVQEVVIFKKEKKRRFLMSFLFYLNKKYVIFFV